MSNLPDASQSEKNQPIEIVYERPENQKNVVRDCPNTVVLSVNIIAGTKGQN